jgi:hypothetical protein
MNEKNVDILSIDNDIKNKFIEENKKLQEYRLRYKEIEECIINNDCHTILLEKIKKQQEELKNKINEIETNQNLQFYLIESIPIIIEYIKILETPIKMSFIGKTSSSNKEKNKLIKEYIKIAKKYTNISNNIMTNKKKNICSNCMSKNLENIDNFTYICNDCHAEINITSYTYSYNDINKIHMTSKFMYDRVVHFKDNINQYQGKQNCTIKKKVYTDLEKEFMKNGLLIDNDKKEIRYRNITKENILFCLKDLGYTKHYENVNLIHYTITGKKPDDISHLETKLINDFIVLVELYSIRFSHLERKNFINNQYVLYQLLRKYKHPCKEEDFSILKTIDRIVFHDNVCKQLFEELGWNHIPIF